ncbi:MAG: alpha/beta hydrolase [Oscillospiraceae bacterium]
MIISHNCTLLSEDMPWLVLIHGFGGTEKMWHHQIDDFKDTHNLLVLELPGHGSSPIGIGAYKGAGFDEVAKSIIDLLIQKNIKKADFICVSLGSLIMASIISSRKDLVNSVVLCGAVFGMTSFSKIIYKTGSCFIHILPFMFSVKLLSKVLMPKETHKISRKFLVEECQKLGRAEFIKWYSLTSKELYSLHNILGLFGNIKNLVIMGREDYIFLAPAKKAARKLCGALNLHIIEDCGHVCSLQKWREFDFIVNKFLTYADEIPEPLKPAAINEIE